MARRLAGHLFHSRLTLTKYSVVEDTLTSNIDKDSVSVKFTALANNTNTNGAASNNDKTTKLFLTDSTQFIGVEDYGDSLKIKTGTGVLSQKASNVTKAYALFRDGKDEAVLVVYVSTDLDAIVGTEDVVYLNGNTSNENKQGYEGSVYFMDDMSTKDIVVKDKTNRGFYTYGVDSDGLYKLDTFDQLGTTAAVTVDKTVTGYVTEMAITNSYNGKLTGSKTVSGHDVKFNDVDYTKATVIDTRDSDDRDEDVYTGEINSPAVLESAIKKGTDVVTKADIYVEDGKVTFVAIREVKNDTTIGGGSASGYTLTTAGTASATTTAITLSGVEFNDGSATAISGLTLTAKVESFSTTTGAWTVYGTYTAGSGIDASGALTTNTISAAIPAGTYRITVTLSSNDFGSVTLFSNTVTTA